MLMGETHAAQATDGTEIYFETYGSRSNPAIFMGPHFYPSRPDGDGLLTDTWIDRLQQDFFVIAADYPRGIGRTPNPQGLAYSPDIAAEEYALIANAAGVDRFGWVGYSFGGAMGVQVACRTDRIAALAVGGFPPLNAPFQIMIDMTRTMAMASPPLPALIDPGMLWTSVAFYTPLADWAERHEISKLTMPKLVFMGDQDTAQGSTQSAPLADNLRAVEDDLRALGWHINWLRGHDHVSALRPDVSLPVVQRFFREALSRT